MTKLTAAVDYSERDAAIAINTYTTVLRRPRVPHELFATYWRDVHGPLCARIPGLGWYVQRHFDREQDAHLWPVVEGIPPFPDYELDGGVEIGFRTAADQAAFDEAYPILFADEQNMFAATVAYALPHGSTTLLDRVGEPSPNGDDGLDRIEVHFGAAHRDAAAFGERITALARSLAAEPVVLKVRLHLPKPYDNAEPAPPAPNVDHAVPDERRLVAVLELAFASPLERRTFYASDAFETVSSGLAEHVAHTSAFAISGVYTYVRDGRLTLAGLRGSRPAQLIEQIGAVNQVGDDVRHLLLTGKMP
ncbi:EthD domain-containing protein [Methylorubrum sp. SB2]|uniref:EthD domain-containing protein n=1 Tax=Methylorubrum subtropicum TaxID=3138812 RepID=UPI00313B92A3